VVKSRFEALSQCDQMLVIVGQARLSMDNFFGRHRFAGELAGFDREAIKQSAPGGSALLAEMIFLAALNATGASRDHSWICALDGLLDAWRLRHPKPKRTIRRRQTRNQGSAK
jgi:hypothetical protein